MPTFLPLDLVLAIVRLAAAREHPFEDWPTHSRRVGHLSLVCKAFKDTVEPLLWKSLVVGRMEHFHKFAGRSGRNTHLLDQVEEFRGGRYGLEGLLDWRKETEEAAFVLRYYLPNLRVYRSSRFGREQLSMEAFTMFEHLTRLDLCHHQLSDVPLDFQLPLLETLSLTRCFVACASYQRLLMPTCTPNLRKLHLEDNQAYNTAFAIARPDLRRLDYAQLVTWDRKSHMFEELGLFRAQRVLYGWSAREKILNLDAVARLTAVIHLRLYPLPNRNTQDSDAHIPIIAPMVDMISQGRIKSLFLPSVFDDTAWSTHRRTRALFFSLLKACRDSETPAIIYDECESEDDFLPAFDRFLASRGDKDIRERLLKENIERVRIWEEYMAEHQLEFAPTRESSGGNLGDTDS